MTDDRNLRTSKATIFGHVDTGTVCRVCGRDVDDGRRAYCSDYCRDIADAVAELLNWKPVRRRILERDDHTCQSCGLSKTMLERAYWQSRRLFDDDRDDYWNLIPEWSSGHFHVDHIQPVSEGGHPFDPSNLQTLCRDCHESKTAGENAAPEAELPGAKSTIHKYVGGADDAE